MARFTAAGHGEALPTFLEVLEQEADDRRQRRIDRLPRSRLPSGKTWEIERPDPSLNWTSWPTATSPNTASTCWHSDCLAPARPTPCARWATAWWRPATPSCSLQPTAWCRNYSPPSENWLCPGNCANWIDLWAAPRGVRGFTLRTLRTEIVHHPTASVGGILTPWPPPRRSVILEFDVPLTGAVNSEGRR